MYKLIPNIFPFALVICSSQAINAQQLRNTYRFYNNLATTEPDCAEELIPAQGLNVQCQPSTSPTSGQFIQDILPGNVVRPVYHNNLNWGLKYMNASGVIKKTYTIQLYLKVTNFNKVYTRILDFSNGVQDDGIYFTTVGTPPGNKDRCLNFYPNGNFGICPFFNDTTYYLLTFTRNDLTKIIDIYVNNQLFTSYNDAADFYTGAAGRPMHIFRDDPVGFACEDGEANFAYLSFANFYSNQADVNQVFQNLNAVVNVADFSITPSAACTGNPVTVNYTGNIPPGSPLYVFSWNWNGGTVLSGSGSGPFVVSWLNPGNVSVLLTITGPCGAPLSNQKTIQLSSTLVTQVDTVACPGVVVEGHSVAGMYSDTFHRAGQCDSVRVLKLSYSVFKQPSLGASQSICHGDSLILSPGDYQHYLWQDGSASKTYTVKTGGLYTVTVSDNCGTGSAQVQVNETNCFLYFPNSFTPNRDGLNETFKVLTAYVFSSFRLSVYNRYGQKIFESTDPSKGWDGKFKGADVEAGAYTWICSYKRGSISAKQYLKGSIMVLR